MNPFLIFAAGMICGWTIGLIGTVIQIRRKGRST